MPTLERITEGCVLGEAPHWDASTQSLYFVDIPGKNLLRYVPSTKQTTKVSVAPKSPTFIIPMEGKKDQFVVSLNNQVTVISWDGQSDAISVLEELYTAERTVQAPTLSFNDAKCDSSGRLWAGTQSLGSEIPKTQPLGSLYTFDSRKTLTQLDGIHIANGLAFNDQTKKFYYIDSLLGTVDQFDFDVNTGSVSNRQVLFTLKKWGIPGLPDGMAIDTDGNLWVALFQGSRVLKIDGSKKETLLDTINMPAEQVTSIAFGGTNLDEIYVTTGCLEIGGKKLSTPENGATYRITGTGARGLPGVNFKLN